MVTPADQICCEIVWYQYIICMVLPKLRLMSLQYCYLTGVPRMRKPPELGHNDELALS